MSNVRIPDGEQCPVCIHPDRHAIDILLFRGFDPKGVREYLRGEDIPSESQLKRHGLLGHQRMDRQAVVAVLTSVIQQCHRIHRNADKAHRDGHIWSYRSQSVTAMKTEMAAIGMIARVEHLITDGQPADANVIEDIFNNDPELLDRIVQNRVAQKGQKIVKITPAPSALARVSPPIEEAETVAEASADAPNG
jgi:hypothetical protein